MKFRFWFSAAVLALVGVFALVNWETFSTPTSLNFLFARVEAPLGILMLAIIAVLVLVYLALLATHETSAQLENRRILKELEQMRHLADSAEESRFTALRELLEHHLGIAQEKLDRIADRIGSGERGGEARAADTPPQPPAER